MWQEYTLVRLKETKEPVMVTETINDFMSLVMKIDEITDPSQCEYVDYEFNLPVEIHFAEPNPNYANDEDVACDAISGGSLSERAVFKLIDVFDDADLEWAEIPADISYSSTVDGAFRVDDTGDLF